jgi:type VI secretion system secreted protein VgrG
MQALRTHGARRRPAATCAAWCPGCTFKLAEASREGANAEYLVLDTRF